MVNVIIPAKVNGSTIVERYIFWKGVMNKYEKSGLKIKDFCSKNNLKHSVFRNWRYRINKKQNEEETVQLSQPKFLPLVVKDQPVINKQQIITHTIELRLAEDGIHIRIPSQFSAEAVSNLLTIIRGIKC